MLLAGDIGGTKSNLAIFSSEGGPRAPLAEATFSSGDYPSMLALVREFLAQVDLKVDRACFGVAGPVVVGEARITNLPWIISEAHLRETLDLSAVWLLNDLLSIAYAIPHLEPADLHTLNEGEPIQGGALAVIAPGTGLGEAYLAWDGTRYRAHASEGGHADFAPVNALQTDLLRHLREQFGHVSYERVCSGPGIRNIYTFLKDSGRTEEPPWLASLLAGADDPVPVVINTGLKDEQACGICSNTLDIFISILGAETGNLALKVLATGGIYLGGGIPPRILPALQQGWLLDAFKRKGRMSDLLARMPVHVILNPKVALLGAACYGLEW